MKRGTRASFAIDKQPNQNLKLYKSLSVSKS